MTTVATVFERVQRICGLHDAQTEVARVLGTTPEVLKKAKRYGQIPKRILKRWCASEGINYDSLVGEEEMRIRTRKPVRMALSQGSARKLRKHYRKKIVTLYGVGRSGLLMVTNEGEKIETTADIYARIVGYQTKGRDND